MHTQSPPRRIALIFGALMLATVLCATTALAAGARITSGSAAVYRTLAAKKPSGKLPRGAVVAVVKEGGSWLRIRYKGKVGYIKKSCAAKLQPKRKAALRTLRPGASGAAVKKMQARLASKGYLSGGGVTGKYGGATRTAVRKFQMFNGLPINGVASAATQKKLFSGAARSEPRISVEPWGRSGIDACFPNRSCATIIDLATGARIRIRRLYGSNHCDVEPAAKSDTARLKAVYGGKWSWSSRGVVLIAGGKCYAAAINSMPHGGQLSRTNGYPGQFCLHLKDSKTHGSERENAEHQRSITKVYAYFQ